MPLIPYLHFSGTCADAMTFYAEVLQGRDLQMLRYRDSPEAPPEWQESDRIIHAQMTLPDGILMASDFPPGISDPQKAVSLMLPVTDVAAGQQLFDRLLDGGDVITAYGPSFFSSGFGMVRDRFGTHWMIFTAGQTPTP